MAGIALLELVLLVVGLLVWAWAVSRNLPPALGEWNHRLEAALAEIGRFLAKPNTEGPILDRLLLRYHELELGFAQGVACLEPPALAELPQRLIEFRENLHPTSPARG